MEEQKITKEVKLNPNVVTENPQKLTYEKLNQVCMELSQQNEQMQKYILSLKKQLQEMNGYLQAKRLDYLFKVVELSDTHVTYNFEPDFIKACIREIQEALTLPAEETSKKEKEE